jgi:hypothetical protein
MSDTDAKIRQARSRILHAQTHIETRRYADVEDVVETGLGFLVGLPEDEEIKEIVAKLGALRVEAAALDAEERAGAKIRSARRDLDAAKSDYERGYKLEDVAYRFDRVRESLAEVPDALKAPVLDEADVLWALLSAREGGTPAPAAVRAEPAAPALSRDMEANISKARTRIRTAKSLVESRRTEGLDAVLDEAAGYLAIVPEEDRIVMAAEIEAIRTEMVDVERAEYARKIESEFDRQFGPLEDVQTWRPDISARALERLTERLAEEKAAGKLAPEILAGYESRIKAGAKARAEVLKADAMERGMPRLEELEARVRTDPFEGLDQSGANRVSGELEHLGYQALHELAGLPADDTDVIMFTARVSAAKEKIEKASQVWGSVQLDNSVREWAAMVENDSEIVGWREERGDPAPRLLETPELPRTRTAVIRLGQRLADAEVEKLRAGYPDNEFIQSTYARVEEERAAAVAHLAAAYEYVLAEAEKQETSPRGDDRYLPLHFATAIRTSFENTSELARLVARTERLDERWNADAEALENARKELGERLTADAEAAWPAIVASIGASADFDPGDTAATGRTVLLSGVYNRAGWDFKNYDFCVRFEGIPVGGSYAQHVQQALEHAWYELKVTVDDHIPWDVIGVVQGPGNIGERKFAGSDEWPNVSCVRLKIIALHAGPVAVGPDHEWRPSA